MDVRLIFSEVVIKVTKSMRNKMDFTCGSYGEKRNSCRILASKCKGKRLVGYLDIDDGMIQKCILGRWDERKLTGFVWF